MRSHTIKEICLQILEGCITSNLLSWFCATVVDSMCFQQKHDSTGRISHAFPDGLSRVEDALGSFTITWSNTLIRHDFDAVSRLPCYPQPLLFRLLLTFLNPKSCPARRLPRRSWMTMSPRHP